MSAQEKPSHIVAIGASAGGLKAIEDFFDFMPADSNLAFVVIQHLSPDHKSMMKEILSKHTKMDIHRAEHSMEVEANSIYLIPPGMNLSIFHNALLLQEQKHDGNLNLPIDIFLHSLAEDKGDRAVAVVLSGTGSDGMRGVRAVKGKGGLVMVQDEDSADFDGMPRASISTGLADFVLPPSEMPRQLLSYLNHPLARSETPSETLLSDQDSLTRIFSLLRERTKVDFTGYKPSTVYRRLERRMTVNQFSDIGEYAAYLERSEGEIEILGRELLIGVTSFFRDPDAWAYLEENVLPEVFENCRDGKLRVWIPGCSTGEEAYSIAILCEDYRQRNGIQDVEIKVFATDIDREAILYASNGIYPDSIAADVEQRLLGKYFTARSGSFQVARGIREKIVFAQHNLLRDPPFTRVSMLTCRNLLIYLQQMLQSKVMNLFNFSLIEGGILFLGSSETTGEASELFESVHHRWKVFRSKGIHRLPRDPNEIPIPDSNSLRGRFVRLREGVLRDMRPHREEHLLERLLQGLSEHSIPLTLVVDDENTLLYVLGDSQAYLRLPSGKQVNDLTRLVEQDFSIPLTTALQQVQGGKDEVAVKNIRCRGDSERELVSLKVRPLPRRRGQPALYMVQFLTSDMDYSQGLSSEAVSCDLGDHARARINDLEGELQFTKENLQATIEELETSNEELQATNEELLSSNEELQSTNEELQSVNEELYTVNAELQSKIVELTELNNDMDNLLRATCMPTLFIDENFELRKFTPDSTMIFNVLEQDLGRPFDYITHQVLDKNVHAAAKRVLEGSTPCSEEVETKDGRCFLMRILPYRIGKGISSGVVITFVEVTEQKRAQSAVAKSEARLGAVARLARAGYWEYDLELEEALWTEEVFHIYELEPGKAPSLEEGVRFYAEASRPVIEAAFEKLCSEGTSYDLNLEIETKKGKRRTVRAIGLPAYEDGRLVKVWGALQDVTPLRQAIAASKEAEAKFRGLFENMLSGVAVYE